MALANTLAYFRGDSKTRIVADAGPDGLGAVLLQLQDNEWRPVSYGSRNLTDVERRYAQTVKEALALCHNYRVLYRPGNGNIADALSRLNQTNPKESSREKEDFVRFVVKESTPVTLTPREVERESENDPELVSVRQYIHSGDWSQCKMPGYICVKNELCTIGQLLLRGDRIMIPQSLRKSVLEAAHERHQGIAKTKSRLTSKVWWPKVDMDGERICKSCHSCQVVGQYLPPEPMLRTEPPTAPWRSPPLWPQANGEVERQNRSLLKTLKIEEVEGNKWTDELPKYLMAYRSTPQESTGATPAFLVFGKEIKSKFPELRPEQSVVNEDIRDRDWSNKLTQKAYADDKRGAVPSPITLEIKGF
ncbi:Uncharacterized protein K02A2.6 [Stylophora pistillata]|uniref:Uncharacterized protein K02A2.6 n=1 Tax=Stylophora pistillata TaxID=50429 RepID=A0A2B4SID0_STYPI|nr:Uncharacterized protein K02A2.6 [Stylophora pistillata]